MNKCRLSYLDLGEPVPIEELGPRRFQDESCHHAAYVDSCVEGLLKVCLLIYWAVKTLQYSCLSMYSCVSWCSHPRFGV
jgi:hypothetical protein